MRLRQIFLSCRCYEHRTKNMLCTIVQADAKQAKDKVVWCASCCNNVHAECFQRWSASKAQNGGRVTCVYCRAPWVDGAHPAGGLLPNNAVFSAELIEPSMDEAS